MKKSETLTHWKSLTPSDPLPHFKPAVEADELYLEIMEQADRLTAQDYADADMQRTGTPL